MGIDTTSANVAMKNIYAENNNIFTPLRANSPTFDRIKKKSSGQGKRLRHAVQTASSQAVGSDFEEAWRELVSQNLGPQFAGMSFPWDEYHAHWSIEAKAMLQMPNKGPGSFLNAMRKLITSSRETVQKMRYLHMFGDRNGHIAVGRTITKVTNAATFPGHAFYYKVTLSDSASLPHFEVGQRLNVAASGTVSNLRGATVASVTSDIVLEVLHVEGEGDLPTVYMAVAAPSGLLASNNDSDIANGAYFYRLGDFAKRGTFLPGLQSWCPENTTDSFFSSDRKRSVGSVVSGRNNELAGFYFDASGAHSSSAKDLTRFEKTVDRIIEAAGIARQRGAMPKYYVVNPRLFGSLVGELGQKVETRIEEDGLKVYLIHGGTGYISLYQDDYCPVDNVFGIRHNDWSFVSLGDLFDPFDEDGDAMRRLQGETKVGGSLSSYATLVTANPLNLVRIKVPNVMPV